MHEDVWIPTVCSNCFSFCPIKVHRVDGVVTKIEGNPDDPLTEGRICARGLSGIMTLYDPHRLNIPLRRSNPEKGIGIDPKWEPISWDEAYEIISEKLKKVRADDPRKFIVSVGVASWAAAFTGISFAMAYGSPNFSFGGAGTHCGNGKHLMGGLTHAAWTAQPDFNYCNYFLNFGVPVGTGAYYGVNVMVKKMAEARARGMKHVCLDPWMGMPGENADEWIPIRPGTDAAVVLAIVNLLINEYGIYDQEYLKNDTNVPYLIKDDGHYLRNDEGKPLMWDKTEKVAKPYDANFKEIALEGSYNINGEKVTTAFSLIREQVKKYTPEMASQISGVPANTIRRLAKEVGIEARIGSTITIEGKELPYRPVTIAYFKGPQAHRHSTLIAMSFELLNAVLGLSALPGSFIGMNARSLGHPETGVPVWSPSEGPDGLLTTGRWVVPNLPWPPTMPQKPFDLGLGQLITTCVASPVIPMVVAKGSKNFGIDYEPEIHFQIGSNFLMTLTDPKGTEEFFKKVFTVNFNIYADESAELADIVLPDGCYLERLDIQADWMANGCATDSWYYPLRQPVVEPAYERRNASQVLLDLAEKAGMLPDMYAVMNAVFEIKGANALDPAGHYSWEEIVDRRYKSWFGEKFNLEWFKKNGILSWPKKPEEVYWHHFVKARIPVYIEHFLTMKEEIQKIQNETGFFKELDLDDYQPIAEWKPCPTHLEKRPDFDLIGIYFRVPFESFVFTTENPWLDEIAEIDPYANRVNINTKTAQKKGIKDDDWVEIESASTGQKIRGRAKLTEGIHPEVIAVSGYGGHWAKGLPIASQPGKGLCFNWLLKQDFQYIDTLSFNQDLCVKIKLSKVNP
jgi:molybdopterin-containing oxidoreductase family molybdopterin binding subunit